MTNLDRSYDIRKFLFSIFQALCFLVVTLLLMSVARAEDTDSATTTAAQHETEHKAEGAAAAPNVKPADIRSTIHSLIHHEGSHFTTMQRLDTNGLHLDYPQEREVVDSSAWPWRVVGQVNVDANRYCSGVLVAPNKVLTVAHCLWNSYDRSWYKPSTVHFVAGYARGNYQAYSRVKSFRASGQFNKEGEVDLTTVHSDWAILTLELPIGKTLGYLPMANKLGSLAVGDKLTLAGYRRDRSEVLTVQRDCRLIALQQGQRVFDHDCEVLQGDSGGPLLVRKNKKWQLLGIQSLEANNGSDVWGVAVTAEPAQLRASR